MYLSAGLILQPILFSHRGVREYRPEGSALRTVRWRVMGSILQTAAIFTISSLAYTVMQFASPIGLSLCHYVFPSIVVRLFLGRPPVSRILMPVVCHLGSHLSSPSP